MITWWWCCPTQKLAEDNRRVVERWINLLRLREWPNCGPSHRANIITDLWKMDSKNLVSQGLGAIASNILTAVSPLWMFSMSISAPCPTHPFPLTLGFPPALLQPHQCWWSIWWAQLGLDGSTQDFGHVSALCCLELGFQQRLFAWLAHRKLFPRQFIGCVRAVVGLFPQVVVMAHLSDWI